MQTLPLNLMRRYWRQQEKPTVPTWAAPGLSPTNTSNAAPPHPHTHSSILHLELWAPSPVIIFDRFKLMTASWLAHIKAVVSSAPTANFKLRDNPKAAVSSHVGLYKCSAYVFDKPGNELICNTTAPLCPLSRGEHQLYGLWEENWPYTFH